MEHPEGYSESIRVSNMELDTIVRKIMSLSVDEIDTLWSESGWIDAEAKEDGRISLPTWRLEKIRSDRAFAEESFISLVSDNPYQELRTAAVFLHNLGKRIEL